MLEIIFNDPGVRLGKNFQAKWVLGTPQQVGHTDRHHTEAELLNLNTKGASDRLEKPRIHLRMLFKMYKMNDRITKVITDTEIWQLKSSKKISDMIIYVLL